MGLFDKDPKTGKIKRLPGNTRSAKFVMGKVKKTAIAIGRRDIPAFPSDYPWPKRRKKKEAAQ